MRSEGKCSLKLEPMFQTSLSWYHRVLCQRRACEEYMCVYRARSKVKSRARKINSVVESRFVYHCEPRIHETALPVLNFNLSHKYSRCIAILLRRHVRHALSLPFGVWDSSTTVIKNRIQTKTRSGERLGRSRDAWAQPSLCLRQGLAVPAPNGFQGLCRPLTLISPIYFWLFGKCPMWKFYGSKCLLEHVFSARRHGFVPQ